MSNSDLYKENINLREERRYHFEERKDLGEAEKKLRKNNSELQMKCSGLKEKQEKLIEENTELKHELKKETYSCQECSVLRMDLMVMNEGKRQMTHENQMLKKGALQKCSALKNEMQQLEKKNLDLKQVATRLQSILDIEYSESTARSQENQKLKAENKNMKQALREFAALNRESSQQVVELRNTVVIKQRVIGIMEQIINAFNSR